MFLKDRGTGRLKIIKAPPVRSWIHWSMTLYSLRSWRASSPDVVVYLPRLQKGGCLVHSQSHHGTPYCRSRRCRAEYLHRKHCDSAGSMVESKCGETGLLSGTPSRTEEECEGISAPSAQQFHRLSSGQSWLISITCCWTLSTPVPRRCRPNPTIKLYFSIRPIFEVSGILGELRMRKRKEKRVKRRRTSMLLIL